ncbi:MAG: Nudix family hydrolase [Pseudomonadota bacterium]
MSYASVKIVEVNPVVDVAAAVIMRPDGSFLLTCRPEGKPYSGYWEFPGGKVEKNEIPLHALDRELQEELGIQVKQAYPWITRVFSYSHATVRLHFFKVTEWQGEPWAREYQALSWQFPHTVAVEPMLPANAPILRALLLPSVYAITHASELGTETSLIQIEQALQQGLRLIQIREKSMEKDRLRTFSEQVVSRAHSFNAHVLINGDMDFSREIGADGVHLTSSQLMTLSSRPDSESGWCGASCHNSEELFMAEKLELDFVILGPVMPTLSHPGLPTLGWRKFSTLIQNYPLPVYALGGLCREDLQTATELGAHGIAMMRGI